MAHLVIRAMVYSQGEISHGHADAERTDQRLGKVSVHSNSCHELRRLAQSHCAASSLPSAQKSTVTAMRGY